MRSNKKHNFYVYCLVNPEDFKPFYVGQTRREPRMRLKEHSRYLTDDAKGEIIKYLESAGTPPIICILEESFCTSDEAALAELFWIEIFRMRGTKTTNNIVFFEGTPRSLDPDKHEEPYPYSAWRTPDDPVPEKQDSVVTQVSYEKAVRHGAPWTFDEMEKVSSAYRAGTPIGEIAVGHQRSLGSISSCLAKLALLK